MNGKKIYNISSYQNYCQELYQFITTNYRDISNIVILLTSKRLCRDLKNCFIADNSNILLPQIKTISEIDYNDFWLVDSSSKAAKKEINLAISNYLEYKILSEVEEIFYIANIVVKNQIFACGNKIDKAISIAKNLRYFFNDIAQESILEIKWNEIDDSNLSSHRQLTLNFLVEFYANIKNNLLKDKIILSSDRSNFILTQIINLIKSYKLAKPLIIAGSRGSSKINRDLITEINNQEKGVIILNNYINVNNAKESNPQFYNNKLIKDLGLKNNIIPNLEEFNINPNRKIRKILTDNIFLDSNNIRELQNIKEKFDIKNLQHDILQNFTLIQGHNEYEEAFQICNILANKTDKKIAIISGDDNFLSILIKQLKIRKIPFNNGISQKIINQDLLIFIDLINDYLTSEFDANLFLAIVKNKLCKYSKNEEILLKFEIEILRQQLSEKSSRAIDFKVKQLEDDELSYFWQSFNEDILIYENKVASISSHIKIIQQIIENLTNKNLFQLISSSLSANEIFDFFAHLSKQNLTCNYSQFVNIFKDIAKNYSFFEKTNSKLNIQLLSPIEARMINCDIVILCALNDGVFPKRDGESWLGKKIRKSLNIENSLKQIGVNACDFCHYLSLPKVILSRHQSGNNSVKAPSQFWLRFQLFCQFFAISLSPIKEKRLFQVKNNIDQKFNGYRYQLNIDKISITEIVKLIHNPYYIYAKKILNLHELPKINYEPSFAEFGSFIHKVLEIEIAQKKSNSTPDIYHEIFTKYFSATDSWLIWWPKFKKIYNNFIKDNEQFKNCKNFLEQYLETNISGKKIYGKIDRIIINNDNSVEIIDYKTGILPTKKDVELLKEPQLIIAALLAHNNNFTNIKYLKYWKLSNKNNIIKSCCNDSELYNLIDDVRINIGNIINYYFLDDNKFKAIKDDQYDSYKHLSRIMSKY
jgi:inactivated superfamily I helicase/RecB family exonuclease